MRIYPQICVPFETELNFLSPILYKTAEADQVNQKSLISKNCMKNMLPRKMRPELVAEILHRFKSGVWLLVFSEISTFLNKNSLDLLLKR